MRKADNNKAFQVKSMITMLFLIIIGIPLFIYWLVKLFTSGMQFDLADPAMAEQAILARIRPVAQLAIDNSGPPGSRSGEAVYQAVCASCHGSGLLNAPKFADSSAWQSRIAQGYETLLKHSLQGFNAMPARGGATDLTDDEVARALVYMANAGGSHFSAPKISVTDVAKQGKTVYDSVCVTCHASGLLNAPKFADKQAWAARLTKGLDAVVATATQGINNMPPKGGYTGSEEAFRAAVEYMVNAAKP